MLGEPWSAMQRIWCRIYYQAALLASKNPDHAKGIVVEGADGKNVKFEVAQLTKGNFHFHPNTDSSFPESTAAQRINLNNVVTTAGGTPLGAALFESPDNWEQFLRLNGHSNLTLTPAMAYEKQTAEIEILLRETPVEPDPRLVKEAQVQHAAAAIAAKQQGLPEPPFAPPQPQCSVPVGKWDYDKWELAKCQEFLSSEACRRELASGGPDGKGNALGVRNVELHADLHQAAMIAKAAQMAALAPPPPPPVITPKLKAAHAPEGAAHVQNQATPPGAATL
jgi:hypothetical protein